jgi:hypothetical protein
MELILKFRKPKDLWDQNYTSRWGEKANSPN